jgi:plastocyanin
MFNLKSYLISRRAVALLLPAAALLAGCEQGSATNDGAPSAQHPTPSSVATPANAATREVSIDNFSFSPPTITVAPGTSITWVNRDDVPHTVTANDKTFNSGTLDTDGRFSRRFTTPGTFSYFCAVHPHMTGTVVVK